MTNHEKAESTARGVIALACGGGGPNPGETSTQFVERLATRVVAAFERQGLLKGVPTDDWEVPK